MRKVQIWSKKAAREHERLKREIAEKRVKACRESEDRQEKIKVLLGLEEQQLRAVAKSPKERKLKEKELKSQNLKQLRKSVRDSTDDDDLINQVGELVELAILQDCEIEYLTRFREDWELIRSYYPEQLEELYRNSLMAAVQPFIEKQLAEEKPGKAWERKRQGYNWRGGVGLIEYEFGGRAEAESKKLVLRFPSALGPYAPAYQPSCLDDILRGGVGGVKMMPSFFGQPPITVDTCTNMRRLQDLFGMNRNRFPKKLRPRRMGTQIVYDYRAVVKIMKALLEKPSQRKRPVRGRPLTLWLGDRDLRTLVLSGIEARLKNLSAPKHIQAAFLPVVRHHLPNSAKK